MKTIYKCLLAIVLIGAVPLVNAADFKLPKYEKLVLQNGLHVYLMEQHEVPLIDVVAVLKVGAIQDSVPGIAALTADNLMLGTKTLDRETLEQTLDFVGASVSATARLESTTISASLAAKDSDLILPILRDILLHPAFSEGEFTRYKTRYLANLEQSKESPRANIGKAFNALLFKGHAYANIQTGNIPSVSSIELNNIKAFYSQWYKPSNAAIVVTGDFDPTVMAKQIKTLFEGWQDKNNSAVKPFTINTELPLPKQAKVLLINKSDATESTFMLGGPGIAQSNPDFIAISVINTILGARFTSWLNDELRVNSGLTYGARSRFDSLVHGGSFAISTFTKTESTIEAIDLALETYARLWKKGIDEATLASAKAYVKGQFPPRYETSSDLAALLANMYIYNFDETYIDTFNDKVDNLTIKQSSRIIEQYFPKENLQFVIIGKASEIKDVVSKYGKVVEADIKDDTLTF